MILQGELGQCRRVAEVWIDGEGSVVHLGLLEEGQKERVLLASHAVVVEHSSHVQGISRVERNQQLCELECRPHTAPPPCTCLVLEDVVERMIE